MFLTILAILYSLLEFLDINKRFVIYFKFDKNLKTYFFRTTVNMKIKSQKYYGLSNFISKYNHAEACVQRQLS